MENPDIARLIGELSTSTDDASDLVKGLVHASVNAGLQADMDAHLGYAHSDRTAKAQLSSPDGGNYRNGSYTKTVGTGYGPVDITVPRDRAGTFRPAMVPKGARRLTELDDMIISLYAGGMTVRDIPHHLSSTLRMDMSPDTISTITDSVLEEVMLWQNRQLDDVFIVCCDEPKGLPEAVEATWPNSMVQTCIVHLIQAANRPVSYQDRKPVSHSLRRVYTAVNEDTAAAALDAFDVSELGQKYPQSVKV